MPITSTPAVSPRKEKSLRVSCSCKDEKSTKPCTQSNGDKPLRLFERSMRCAQGLSPLTHKGYAAGPCGEHATSDWRERACSIFSRPLLSTWYEQWSGSRNLHPTKRHRSRLVNLTSPLWRKLLHEVDCLQRIRQQSQCMDSALYLCRILPNVPQLLRVIG